MQPHRQELVTAFIERHRLHLPGEHRVNLTDLHKVFRPIVVSNLACPSMVVRIGDWVQIWLRKELSAQEMRISYVHELMHVVLEHRGTLSLSKVNAWFYGKDEQEAWEATAMVFVPRETFYQAPDTRWLSMVTHTPIWLIHMLPLLKQHFAFPAIGRPAVFG